MNRLRECKQEMVRGYERSQHTSNGMGVEFVRSSVAGADTLQLLQGARERCLGHGTW